MNEELFNEATKSNVLTKKLIDQLRLRNGNLEISLGHQDNAVASL